MISAWVVDRSSATNRELGKQVFAVLPRAGEVIGILVGAEREWFIVERIDHHAKPDTLATSAGHPRYRYLSEVHGRANNATIQLQRGMTSVHNRDDYAAVTRSG